MPLGTLDRNPPPMFRQGYSALSKLVFFSALALFLMVADTRFKMVLPLRAAIATVLSPVERALRTPLEVWRGGGDYLGGLSKALAAEDAARRQLAAQAERAARGEQLAAENARLRALLELRPAIQVRSVAAEVLYEAPDPYSRKVFLDRGSLNGIALGSPVVNEAGVLGQVTRVYPLNAEVSLLTDKDAAIPVLNTRTQQRSAAFGTSLGGGMELRFIASNADVKEGDLLTTSGVDGVYPAGLAVARVVSVDRKGESGFAHILLAPTAKPDSVRHVLVLEPLGLQMPKRPEPEVPIEAVGKARKAKGKPADAASAAASAPARGASR
ncbi:rod shape-determining protein MreC [Ideonella sp. BN130291]|uniref:rod shape-determining protein MreC n=1 Tax=Ideonella sp. BN130291 TaxID=3112940 RepID=UPI002E25D7C7|nr:rod shape-determining protein MreC [Ideonella sp. BN130291]